MNRRLLLAPMCALLLGSSLWVSSNSRASRAEPATPTPGATPTPEFFRDTKPDNADSPRQQDEGARYYWGGCMPCHGDAGQGLTDAWRARYGEQASDCWASGCHGDDHAAESFRLPRDRLPPAFAGPGALARFDNSQQLTAYILEAMPWGLPGSVTPETAWAVSAYLLKLHGIDATSFQLGPTNGSAIPVHRKVSAPSSALPGTLALSGLLTLAAVGLRLRSHARGVTAGLPLLKPNFVDHLHPPSIPALQARFRYTLGTGGLAVFLSLVLLFTGLLEMYFYIPAPEHAAISVEIITTLVPFGALIRNLHFWSAQVLVAVMSVHLLRVVLTGAYAPPRRVNYLIGLGLLVTILLLDFTGYVLRWDEGIRWALVVGANLLKTIPGIGAGVYRFVIGGDEPGPAALTRFYAWHIFGLTLAAGFLTVWHAFRVRRDGGIAVPPPAQRESKARIPRFELLQREVLAMVIATVLLLLVSALLPAPIDQPLSGQGTLTSDARAPWFFLWVQQLLKWGDPFPLGVLAPVLVVIALGLLPYLLPGARPEELGRWFPRGNRLAQALAVTIILAILVLTVMGAVR